MMSLSPSRFALPAAFFAAGLLVAGVGFRLVPGVLGLEASPAAAAEPVEMPATRPLAWADLRDANTATFAENLRGIGCPEDTIMRIVSTGRAADAGQSANAGAGSASAPQVLPVPSASSVAPVASAAVALPVVPAAPPPQYPPAPAAPEVVIVAPAGSVPLPVAFQSLPQDAGMTPAQVAQLNAIQEEFIAAIGGPNQDPASAEYRDRWRQAQRRSDAAFKAAFGQGAFLRRHMAMLQEAAPGS